MQRLNFEQIPDELMSSMMKVENTVNKAGFDQGLLELIRYYVSQINQCAYCMDMHYKEAIAAGETEQRLHSIMAWRETGYYNEQERAVLEWTESVTQIAQASAEQQFLFENLSEYFSPEDIANLTLAITQINSWTRLAKSFGFEAGSYEVGQH